MTKQGLLSIVAIVLCLNSGQGVAAIATGGSVYLFAEPGSYVGGGIGADEVLWTHGVEGIFSVERNADLGVKVLFDDGDNWRFEFAAPTFNPDTNTNDGNELEVGFYDQATRYPFNSPTRPGLSFSGNGRGNNTLGGWFDVLEVGYDVNGDVLSFAVDFRQYDESEAMIGPSTYGSLRINSAVPINPVPVPPAVLLFSSAALLIGGLRRRKRG